MPSRDRAKRRKIPARFFCPRCGARIKFDPHTFYHCNPDAFPTRRIYGFLCYNCHALVFVCENGKLDVIVYGEQLGKGRYIEGEIPKFDIHTGKPLSPEALRNLKQKSSGPRKEKEHV